MADFGMFVLPCALCTKFKKLKNSMIQSHVMLGEGLQPWFSLLFLSLLQNASML